MSKLRAKGGSLMSAWLRGLFGVQGVMVVQNLDIKKAASYEAAGGDDRIRTGEWRFCRPLPYHLATSPPGAGSYERLASLSISNRETVHPEPRKAVLYYPGAATFDPVETPIGGRKPTAF